MNRFPLCLVISLLLVLGADAARSEHDSGTRQIMDLEAAWSSAFGERDLDAIMALMAKDSVLIAPGSSPIVGVDAIRAATRDMLALDDRVSWKSDFASVSASGDMAYDYGTATTTFADGSTATGHYLVVWIREEGAWKVAADMFN